MAIHPIDLSTVYSQMDKVAKYSASQNQMTQAANQAANTQAANQMAERAQAVQQTAQEDTDTSAKVRPDGRNADAESGEQEPGKQKEESPEPDEEPRRRWELKDPRVGNFIDISR